MAQQLLTLVKRLFGSCVVSRQWLQCIKRRVTFPVPMAEEKQDVLGHPFLQWRRGGLITSYSQEKHKSDLLSLPFRARLSLNFIFGKKKKTLNNVSISCDLYGRRGLREEASPGEYQPCALTRLLPAAPQLLSAIRVF